MCAREFAHGLNLSYNKHHFWFIRQFYQTADFIAVRTLCYENQICAEFNTYCSLVTIFILD